MQPVRYACYQFPPEIIQDAVWLYLRFSLNYRDVEELRARWEPATCDFTALAGLTCR